MTAARPTGDDLVEMLAALANPLRLRIVGKLSGGRDYVGHLAREIGVSRPLMHLHLLVKELVEAGRYRAVVDRCYPLEQVVEATRYVETEQ
jgi:DNA-binding transcriptional ArsR family regulator